MAETVFWLEKNIVEKIKNNRKIVRWYNTFKENYKKSD